ncbi:MAG: hypothetical protein RIA64_01425 [Rhodospirillales bacterium]
MSDIETRRSAEMEDHEIFDDGPQEEPADQTVDLEPAKMPEGVDLEPEAKVVVQEASPFDDQGPFDETAPQEGDPAPQEPHKDTRPQDKNKGKDADPLANLSKTERAYLDAKFEEMEKTGKVNPKIQRRINKEVGARKAAETEAEQLRQEVQQLRQGVGGMRLQALNATISDLEGRANALRARAAQELEAGNTEEYLKLNDQMVDTRARLLNAQGIKARMAPGDDQQQQLQPNQQQTSQQTQTYQPPQPNGAPDVSHLPQRAQDWMAERDFMNWTAAAKHYAHGVDHDLTQEGYDPNSAEYFAEMDQRIQRAFPTMYDAEASGEPPNKPAPRKNTQGAAPVAEPSNVTGKGAPRGKVVLTADDQAVMRQFGLDPTNPEHVQEFARNKAQSA